MFGGGGGEAKAAATSYQVPCFPYNKPNYAFKQYVSGWGYHVAEDSCHKAGLAVFAAGNGVVKYSARTPDSYRWGNLIVIEHTTTSGNKILSLYGHLGNDRKVRAGQTVFKGQRIGTVGPSGSQNGYWSPHIHFGIRIARYGAATGSYDHSIHGYEYPCCAAWTGPSAFVNARRASYDYVPHRIAGTREMWFNSDTELTFQVWNTGGQTWRTGGDTPLRLGTARTHDRTSVFADGGAADGWAGVNRIELLNDTGPDQLATFRATFESPGASGHWTECFAPLVEGVKWLKDRGLCTGVTVHPPTWRGEYVGQRITASSDPADMTATTADHLKPGDTRSLKLFIKNTGELAWVQGGSNPTRLATANPRDRTSAFRTSGLTGSGASENWVSGSRASELEGRYDPDTDSIVADTEITTGEIGAFSFTVTAPDLPGSHKEYFNPVVEGKRHMPYLGIWFGLNVLDRGYHYGYESQSQTPTTVGSGVTEQEAVLRLRNTGRESWPVDDNLRIGTARPRDHQSTFHSSSGSEPWIARSRPSTLDANVTDSGKTAVDPGEVGEFRFTINVPENLPVGTYKLYVRPVLDGVAWLPEDYGIYFPVKVTAPPISYRYEKQDVSGDAGAFERGTTMTARLAVTNTGRRSWDVDGQNAVRLGTSRPQDRGSAFRTTTGSDPWIAANRASAIDGRVTDLATLTTTPDTSIDPGETALFSFPLTANPAPGNYKEYFNLVMERVTWMRDIGIYYPLTVVAP